MARPADPLAREALVAAARAEFARRGLRGARIEDITAACGLSKGAFYLHFPTKESLFGELVGAFLQEMERCFEARTGMMTRFASEHGAIGAVDVARRSPRYRLLLSQELELDRRTLEALWTFRDVFGVLVSGCQGTPFERTVWEISEREVQRVSAEFGGEQEKGACRTDVSPVMFGTLIVGTYLLLAQRMTSLARKPDLLQWAASIQTLARDGSAPARTLRSRRAGPPAIRGRSATATTRKTRSSQAGASRTPST